MHTHTFASIHNCTMYMYMYKLERPFRDKPYSLLLTFINCGTKIFTVFGPGGHSSSFILNVSNNYKKFYKIVICLEDCQQTF